MKKKLFLLTIFLFLIVSTGHSQGKSWVKNYIQKIGFSTVSVDVITVNDSDAVTLPNIESIEADTLSSATGIAGVTYSAALNKTTITLTVYSMPIVDSAGNGGHGTLKLVDFPEGMIYVLGVIGDMSITSQTGSADNAVFDMALGSATTLTNAQTLGNANVDFVAKVDGTLSSGADTIDLVTNTPQTEDGHTTATDVWLCVAIEDAFMSSTGTMVMSGTVVITWVNTGDY